MTDKKKILVIDDDPNLVSFLTMLLQDNGYDCITASDGKEGMEQVTKNKPDLILLDITMPETTGVRFYRNIKDQPDYSSIPVVMVTGVMKEFERFISTRRQVPPPDAYFSKPVDKDALIKKVGELLA